MQYICFNCQRLKREMRLYSSTTVAKTTVKLSFLFKQKCQMITICNFCKNIIFFFSKFSSPVFSGSVAKRIDPSHMETCLGTFGKPITLCAKMCPCCLAVFAILQNTLYPHLVRTISGYNCDLREKKAAVFRLRLHLCP